MEPSARDPEYSFLLEPLGEKTADLMYREGDRTLAVFLKRAEDPEPGWVGEEAQLRYWTEPAGETIPADHQALILTRLAEWARTERVPVHIPTERERMDAFLGDLEQQGFVVDRKPDGTFTAHDPRAKAKERPKSFWTQLKEILFPPAGVLSPEEWEAYRTRLNRETRQHKRLSEIADRAVDAVASAVADRTPRLRSHFTYGMPGGDPKNLGVWYLFDTDAEHREARRNGLTEQLDSLTRAEMVRLGYPPEAVPKISVSFTTDETIQREAGGNYRIYFQ